jgi:hypothetical protein
MLRELHPGADMRLQEPNTACIATSSFAYTVNFTIRRNPPMKPFLELRGDQTVSGLRLLKSSDVVMSGGLRNVGVWQGRELCHQG